MLLTALPNCLGNFTFSVNQSAIKTLMFTSKTTTIFKRSTKRASHNGKRIHWIYGDAQN
jgi:hypothetical protein